MFACTSIGMFFRTGNLLCLTVSLSSDSLECAHASHTSPLTHSTATADGFALATAVCEHLHDTVQCRTLFATHFHDLYRALGARVFADQGSRHSCLHAVNHSRL